MAKTEVVNIRSKVPEAVYIGRPVPSQSWGWGNPFPVAGSGRDECIAKFEAWLRESEDLRARWMRNNVHKLQGKRLACFCAPLRCHGDVLAKYADMDPTERAEQFNQAKEAA